MKGKQKSNPLGFEPIGSSKKEKKIAMQEMLVRALALVFLPLNFCSNPGGKLILEWFNGGVLPPGVSLELYQDICKFITKEMSLSCHIC